MSSAGPSTSTERNVTSSRSRSPGPNSTRLTSADLRGSTNSLSTTASTSSRTLKTPHSSKTDHNPIIASASGSFENSPTVPLTSQRSKPPVTHSSPTPNRTPVPPMAQGPLPPIPPADAKPKFRGTTKPLNVSGKSKPAPLPSDSRPENRLSQDWIQVNLSENETRSNAASDEKPAIPARSALRLPQARMVPMKLENSPDRPRFDRAVTAPPLSPTPKDQRGGRKSLDQLRSTSPTPRPRQTSLSTPPAAVLDAAASSSQIRNGQSKPEKPMLRTRRSEELLRSTKESPPSKRELRAQQHRTLGVASTVTTGADVERKPTVISLKKSSGALKALFKSGKGKEKERERERSETPPPMPMPRRKSGDELRRPSRPPVALSSSPSSSQESPEEHGRASFTTERQRYPTAPPMTRAASASAATSLDVPTSSGSRARLPSRDLPPPPREASPVSAPPEQPSSTPSVQPLPPSSSLPYLSTQANRVSLAPPADITTPSSEEMRGEEMHSRPSPVDFSPIKPSKSLHLLQLPELDLDFDFALFDKFGSGSPATPRRSPRKSPRSPNSYRKSPNGSPARSFSTRSPRNLPTVQPQLKRTASERRRSQSFDGPAGSVPMLDDLWKTASDIGSDPGSSGFVSPSMAKFFASASASSAPVLSQPMISPEKEAQPLPLDPALDSSDEQSRSESSHQSSDHIRTPSNASSTDETPSPSPPRTPPAPERSLAGLGFGDLSPSSTVTTSTPTPAKQPEPPMGAKKPTTFTEAPTIPLPAPPAPSLAPPAIIEASKADERTKELQKPRERVMSLMSHSKVVVPDQGVNIRSLAREVERLLYTFRYPSQTTTSADRAMMIRNDLLTLMVEIDKRSYNPAEEQTYAMLRSACFEWADALLFELGVEQPANERGACLEGLAAIVESACLSEVALERCLQHQARFTSMMIKCMTFVMSKLGAKGVFHNTLLFSGRFLAFAFFRIPHVGEQLVTVLQPPKGALMRFTRGILMGASQCPVKPDYPKHLEALCFDNSKSYTARLASISAEFPSEEERDAFLFQPGNWLRRWQSDDSELFPAFYRAYHRQLANYLGPVVQYYETLNRPVPASVLLRAPGYAHLATIFAKKCHSYILGSVNAVTTSSSSTNFEATETAGFRGSQKPPVLETANRRLVETISTFANLRVMIPDNRNGRVIECDGTQLWTDMIDVWTKNLISKTSLYAPKGVFSLFDLLDGIVDPPYDCTLGRPLPIYSLLDVPHLIYVIRMILTEGEHALTLVKVIAFVFTHWEVLTARAEDRKELCLDLLLQKELFERLLLFWSQSVRSYVLRLVVFRLGHLHTKQEDGAGHLVEIESVKLLQSRLDRIKKRHDELEPKPVGTEEESKEEPIAMPLTPVSEDGFNIPRSRSTITMVTDSPKAGGAQNRAEKLLGLGLGMEGRGEGEIETTGKSGMSKATNWFKKSFGNKKKRKDQSGSISSSPSPSPSPAMDAASPESSSPSMSSVSGSPQLGKSPKPLMPEQLMQTTTNTSSPLDSPVSTEWSGENSSSNEAAPSTRKARPPVIITTSPSQPPPHSPTSNGFAFEFELPTMSPRSDTFDFTPSTLPTSPNTKRRSSQPPSPGQPNSPHMSRSFSKRSSLLPSSTVSALNSMIEADERNKGKRKERNVVEEEKGYHTKLHAYAIRMLAELEDAQKEYDEWWADGGIGRVDGAPPRLTVAWPFHEGEE
ncbi:hypothetical protein I316_05068 [Kwoniella heveanensis BCC8398]|uniref:Uncharacterized protein n=1 Tax=Kwoniella heveanensis BCC8398 TaxID=1296120 RepID=A0A1B9GQQ5_9TREE|nr:hypothetical protein I316_05068 [Kwoniella heveanensis BCC8398]